MNVFRDGVIAFFSAVGMTTVVWLLAGAVLHAGRPTIPGLLLVLPVRGEALALEHDVRELRRVRSSLPGARIVIADCGLTAEARGLADYLAEREDNAAVWTGRTSGWTPETRDKNAGQGPCVRRTALHRHVKERKSWKN